MPKSEETSLSVGSIAGQILNGKAVRDAEDWLVEVITNPLTTETARTHATALIGMLASARSVAASALTQRPDKPKAK